MSIADIGKAMAMYAQPTEFDQNAWKQAFDIANAFTATENNRTTADENARKLAENYATQDWRVKASNAQNQDLTNLSGWNIKTRDATGDGKINALNAQNRDLTNSHDWNVQTRNATQDYKIKEAIANYMLNTKQHQVGLSSINDLEQLNQIKQQAILAGQNPDYAYLLNPDIAKQFSPTTTVSLYDQKQQNEFNYIKAINEELAKAEENAYVKKIDNNTGLEVIERDPEVYNQYLKGIYARYPNYGAYIGEYHARRNGNFLPQTGQPVVRPNIIGYTQPTAYPAITGYTPPQPAVPYAVPQSQMTPQMAQQTPTAPVVKPQVAPVDYRKEYNITDDFIPLIQQYQQETGVNEQTALKELSYLFSLAQQGYISPENIRQTIQEKIKDAILAKPGDNKERIARYDEYRKQLN
ncbi:hypothetical protein [Lonepinella sp. BR2474]|uniref:hypothetical protein n=1 Tax=Lonepinella sp. BR2474 TaxID=3434548 RepID=UPI003F6E2ABE